MSDSYKYTIRKDNKFLNDKDAFELRKTRVKVEDGDNVTYVDTVSFDTEEAAEAKAAALSLPKDSYVVVRFKLEHREEAAAKRTARAPRPSKLKRVR